MKQPLIAFRTKASPSIGFGHLRRCMTLANALKKQGATSHFLVNHDHVAERLLKDNQFKYSCVDVDDDKYLHLTLDYLEQSQSEVLAVDSYDIDTSSLKGKAKVPVMVIDDRVNNSFYANLFLNPALRNEDLARVRKPDTTYLTGLDYILLDEIFYSSVTVDRKLRRSVSRILLTVGGGDASFLTPILIRWIREVFPEAGIDVVVGPFFSDELKKQLSELEKLDGNIVLHKKLFSLYQLMMECDLAVTGGGQTTYELAATGTPALAIQLIDNQAVNLKYLSDNGVLICAGELHDKDLHKNVIRALSDFRDDWELRLRMSKLGPKVVDGRGALRVANKMLEFAGIKIKE